LLILVPFARPADEHAQLLALLLLVLVAAAAYHFVEDPIRRGARWQATP
jgi:peptidoglycan/LPS O-acetylase OafA/YrhL